MSHETETEKATAEAEAEATAAAAPAAPEPEPAKRGGRWTSEDVDQPWTLGDAIGVAMRALRGHFLSLFVPFVVVQIVGNLLCGLLVGGTLSSYGLSAIVEMLQPQKASPFGVAPPVVVPPAVLTGVGIGAVVVLFVTGALALSFLVEAGLYAVRDEKVPAGRVKRAFRRVPRILGWELLLLIPTALLAAVLEGTPYLIANLLDHANVTVPWYLHLATFLVTSLYAAVYCLLLGWTPFFFVDDDVSLFTGLRRSWKVSSKYVGTLFLYFIALSPIALIILVPLVGIVAHTFIWLGLAYGYVRATGRNELPWYAADFASRSLRTFLKILFVALGVVAGGLVAWVKRHPMSSTAWSIQETILHAAAILLSVGVVIVLLALLLPYVLDRLEGNRFTSFVAARHVRSQKSGFLTVISVLSICGVAISSCALSGVIGVMDGFSQDLKRKILGNSAHIVIDTTSAAPWGEYEETLEAIRKVPGVVGAAPVVKGEVMASSASNLAGVVVTGIEPSMIDQVIDLNRNIQVGKMDYLEHPEKLTKLPPNEVIGIGPGGEKYYKGTELPSLQDDLDPDVRAVIIAKPDRPGIILGLELAKTLHVYVGDEVTLVSPLGDLGPMGIMPRTKRFRVAAIFDSGMYEYDAMNVYTMLEDAQDYFATGKKISSIDVKVEDADVSDRVLPAVEAAVNRPELRIRDWREINKNLFSALKLERIATFIILSIAIIVASFCIVCTLLLMVTEKGKEIAILKAIGASDGSILRTFMIEGVIIGGIGTIFGVVTGLALCSGLKWIGLPLPGEVYYIHGLPVSVNGWNFLVVAVAALTICTLSTVYPAYAASRLRPVDGLRYE